MGKGGHCLEEKANERETDGVRWNWIRTTQWLVEAKPVALYAN